jgi:hypothetical protein
VDAPLVVKSPMREPLKGFLDRYARRIRIPHPQNLTTTLRPPAAFVFTGYNTKKARLKFESFQIKILRIFNSHNSKLKKKRKITKFLIHCSSR